MDIVRESCRDKNVAPIAIGFIDVHAELLQISFGQLQNREPDSVE
jgi:hypothetical protein